MSRITALVREAFDYSLMLGNFHLHVASEPNVEKGACFLEEN
jgi:hypothetical protein